ncbi:MAG: DUF2065 family protein [Porticoccaceae bacterium]|jgi:uncharacterized protein YjeT (DUF2065 family)
MWLDLAKAFCLVLVIEGIMPFLAPARWRNLAQLMAQIDDRTMRIMGLISMVVGALLLFLLR